MSQEKHRQSRYESLYAEFSGATAEQKLELLRFEIKSPLASIQVSAHVLCEILPDAIQELPKEEWPDYYQKWCGKIAQAT